MYVLQEELKFLMCSVVYESSALLLPRLPNFTYVC